MSAGSTKTELGKQGQIFGDRAEVYELVLGNEALRALNVDGPARKLIDKGCVVAGRLGGGPTTAARFKFFPPKLGRGMRIYSTRAELDRGHKEFLFFEKELETARLILEHKVRWCC